MNNQDRVYNDHVTKCGIILVKEKMYILKDGKRMRLNAFIIKERKGN